MPPDTLAVPRAVFSIEDPWAFPPACRTVRMRRSTDGATPRLATSFAVYFDDSFLTVLYSAADDHVVETHLEHDGPLYEEDVFEAFLAPETLHRYFELEVNPRGTTFDAVIESPDGVRATMHADRDWNCEGLFAAVRKVVESDGAMSIDSVFRIPFASLGRSTPRDGERWRANFFRIDRHPRKGDEFSAWQPTMKSPPDFHVAAVFGTLSFRA
ncbi:MAG: carbohydrate-binding family 9-like protein [Thermoanaerobaculia bacterium]